MLLFSLESLPCICKEPLKYIYEHLTQIPSIAFVTGGTAALSPAPRPAPAPGDPYHELWALLQRLASVRLVTMRNPQASLCCLLDGWIPAASSPHPLLRQLQVDLTAAALVACGITSHQMIYLRGCPHESFERLLEAEHSESIPTLADLMGGQERLDAVILRNEGPCTPFPLLKKYVVQLPTACDDNPLAAETVGRRAVGIIQEVLSKNT